MLYSVSFFYLFISCGCKMGPQELYFCDKHHPFPRHLSRIPPETRGYLDEKVFFFPPFAQTGCEDALALCKTKKKKKKQKNKKKKNKKNHTRHNTGSIRFLVFILLGGGE